MMADYDELFDEDAPMAPSSETVAPAAMAHGRGHKAMIQPAYGGKYAELFAEPHSWRMVKTAHPAEAAAAEDANRPGLLESLARGAAQGATLGFADEIQGGVESLLGDKTYQQARDDARAKYAAAEEAHPFAYGAGGLAGGAATALVPGLGLAKGASLAKTVGSAALAGGIGGVGSSTADFTKGDIGGLAKDAVIGAGVGGALGAAAHGAGKLLNRVVEGAPERADRQLLQDITNRQWGKAEKRIGLNASETAKAIREAGIDRVGRSADARLAATEEALRGVESKRLGPIYESIEHAPVRLGDVTAPLEERASELRKIAGTKDRANAIEKYISDLREAHAAEVPDALIKQAEEMESAGDKLGAAKLIKDHVDASPVKPSVLRREVTAAQERAFENVDPTNPNKAKRFAAQISGDIRDVLQSHVGKVAGPEKLEELRNANKLYSLLKPVEQTTEKAAAREAFDRGGLRNISENATSKIARVGALLGGGPTMLAKELAVEGIGKGTMAGARAADRAVARLVLAARSGNVSAQAIRDAIESGVPRATVNAIVGAKSAM